jgi:hypothetical protein
MRQWTLDQRPAFSEQEKNRSVQGPSMQQAANAHANACYGCTRMARTYGYGTAVWRSLVVLYTYGQPCTTYDIRVQLHAAGLLACWPSYRTW